MPTPRRRILLRLAVLAAAGIAAGCGQKGPLYHPRDDDEARDPERPSDTAGAVPQHASRQA